MESLNPYRWARLCAVRYEGYEGPGHNDCGRIARKREGETNWTRDGWRPEPLQVNAVR